MRCNFHPMNAVELSRCQDEMDLREKRAAEILDRLDSVKSRLRAIEHKLPPEP